MWAKTRCNRPSPEGKWYGGVRCAKPQEKQFLGKTNIWIYPSKRIHGSILRRKLLHAGIGLSVFSHITGLAGSPDGEAEAFSLIFSGLPTSLWSGSGDLEPLRAASLIIKEGEGPPMTRADGKYYNSLIPRAHGFLFHFDVLRMVRIINAPTHTNAPADRKTVR